MLRDTVQAKMYKSVVLIEPDVVKCQTDTGDTEILTLGKDALTFLYGCMGIPFSASKKLYEKSKDLWETLKINCLIANDNIKGLSQYVWVVYQDNLVMSVLDMELLDVQIEMDKFDESAQKAQITINKDGTIQMLCKEKQEDGGSSVILVDINPVKGTYAAYNGILTPEPEYLVVLPTPIVSTKSFYEFLGTMDLGSEILMAYRMYSNVFKIFTDETAISNTKISVREVVDLLKKSKCEVTLDKKKNLTALNLVDSDKIVTLLSAYQLPYKSLIKLETLKKSLSYGDMTILEMLEILTKNYMIGSNCITSDVVAKFLKPYYDNRTDRNITDECLPTLK